MLVASAASAVATSHVNLVTMLLAAVVDVRDPAESAVRVRQSDLALPTANIRVATHKTYSNPGRAGGTNARRWTSTPKAAGAGGGVIIII